MLINRLTHRLINSYMFIIFNDLKHHHVLIFVIYQLHTSTLSIYSPQEAIKY